jgi:hypothetical protein
MCDAKHLVKSTVEGAKHELDVIGKLENVAAPNVTTPK